MLGRWETLEGRGMELRCPRRRTSIHWSFRLGLWQALASTVGECANNDEGGRGQGMYICVLGLGRIDRLYRIHITTMTNTTATATMMPITSGERPLCELPDAEALAEPVTDTVTVVEAAGVEGSGPAAESEEGAPCVFVVGLDPADEDVDG